MATVGLFFIIQSTSLPGTPAETATSPPSVEPWRSACSATSAWRPLRSPRPRCATRRATSAASTILGTLASAVVYMLSMVAVFGILPASALAQDANKASYSAAADAIVGGVVGRQPGRPGRHRLGHRRTQRLDHDLRGDATRRGQGRPLPQRFAALLPRGAGLRDRRLDRPRLARGGHQLSRHRRCHRVHHPGPDDRHHLRPSPTASLHWRRSRGDGRTISAATPRAWFDLVLAVVALVFSVAFIYYSRNTGDSWYVVWGPFLMAGGASVVGIPVYLAMRSTMTRCPPRCPAHDVRCTRPSTGSRGPP